MQLKKESKVLTVSNVITDTTGIYDYFFDFEQSVSSSAITLHKESVEIEVLQYQSNLNH